MSEQAGAKKVLTKLNQVRDSEALPPPAVRFNRLITIWDEVGYRGQDFAHWVIDVYRWILSVRTVRRSRKDLLSYLQQGLLSGLLVGLTGVED
ncbi:transposase [Kalymmatonema gypsitolerans NIES-4073]|nr:transposase [Scytonema sp. NIES-4073]